MKEKFEFTPEEKQEATQLSKDDFLYNIDVLTERKSLGGAISNTRMGSFLLEDGRWTDVMYSPELPIKERTPEDIRAQLNIRNHPVEAAGGKITSYFLRQNGSIDSFSKFFSKEEEKELKEMWGFGEKWKRRMELKEEEWAAIEKSAEKGLRAIEEEEKVAEAEKEIGLAFVSEAELRELNALLKKIIEQEKEKRENKQSPIIPD